MGTDTSKESGARSESGGWLRSSYCMSGACVEARRLSTGQFEIRDSKEIGSTTPHSIILSQSALSDLFAVLGGNATPTAVPDLEVLRLEAGGAVLRSQVTGVELAYDADEIAAFLAGRQEFLALQ